MVSKTWIQRESSLFRIKRIKLAERTASFQIRDNKTDDSIRLGLTYHPALNQLNEILRRAHKHVLKDFLALYHHHQGELLEIQN